MSWERCRATWPVRGGQTGVAGLVLGATGLLSAMSITAAAALAGNVGNGTITAAGSVTFTDAAKDGTYVIRVGTGATANST